MGVSLTRVSASMAAMDCTDGSHAIVLIAYTSVIEKQAQNFSSMLNTTAADKMSRWMIKFQPISDWSEDLVRKAVVGKAEADDRTSING